MAVDANILTRLTREYFGADGPRVEQTFRVAWAERLTFIKEMLGGLSGGILYPPAKYEPEGNEAVGVLYARSAEIVPTEEPSRDPELSWGFAQVRITYGPPNVIDPPEGEDVYVTESLVASGEYLTLPRKGLFFGSGDGAVSLEDYDIEVPTKIMPMLEWQYIVHRYATIPSAILTLPGRINSSAVYSRSLGLTFPAQTLLCGPIEMTREYTSLGTLMPTVTWHFLYKNNGTMGAPKGWQHFPRTDGGEVTWERITDGIYNINVYEEASFSGVII